MLGRGWSKRNIRRLIKQKKIEYVKNLHSPSNNVEDSQNFVNLNTNNVDLAEESEAAYSFESTTLPSAPISLREKLKDWYIRNRPTRKTVEELLAILNEENLDVPLSIKTLLPNNEKAVIKDVSPGVYSHFGIRNQFESIHSIISEYDEIVVDVNIDGLPLFKSSRAQLWPILLRVVNIKNLSVIPIGIYLGKSKPNDISEFLAELRNLLDRLKSIWMWRTI